MWQSQSLLQWWMERVKYHYGFFLADSINQHDASSIVDSLKTHDARGLIQIRHGHSTLRVLSV